MKNRVALSEAKSLLPLRGRETLHFVQHVALVALALFLTACVGGEERVLTPVVGEPIPVGNHPSAIAFTEDAVWVANFRTVSRIDPDTRQVVATIRLKLEPGSYHIPVDPNTGQVLATDPESAHIVALAAGEGSVWVLSSDGGRVRTVTDKFGTTSWPLGSVSRIDPKTNQEVARIPVGGNWIAVGEGAVWVVSGEDGTLSRIDPEANQVAAIIPIAAAGERKRALGMAVGEGAIWIASGTGDVIITRVNPKTNEVVANIPVARALGGRVAVGEGSIWVACSSFNGRLILPNSARVDPNTNPADWLVGSVVRIDPGSNSIVATIPVPGSGLATAEGSVWITNYFAGTLTQIDAKTNKVVGEPIMVGTPAPSNFDLMKDEASGPNAIAVRKGTLWVALEGDDVIKPVMLGK